MKTLSTRGRKFNSKKYVISRAWEIAKNATVAHNTSPIKVAQHGLVKPTEYLSESMKIAWVEAKAKMNKEADFKTYSMHKVPKKNQHKILADIALTVLIKGYIRPRKNEPVHYTISRAVDASKTHSVVLAEAIFNSRYGTPVAKSQNRHELKAIREIA